MFIKFGINYTNLFFLLEQQQKKVAKQNVKHIDSSINDILVYKFELENCFIKKSPLWIQQKLKNRGIESSNTLDDFLNLVILEYGSTITSNLLPTNEYTLKIERLSKIKTFKGVEIPAGSIVLTDSDNNILNILGILSFIENSNSFSLEGIFYDIYENNLSLNTINTKLSFKHLRMMFIENFKVSFKRLLTLLELYNPNLNIKKIYKTSTFFNAINKTKIIPLSKILIKNILGIEIFRYEIFKKAGLKIVGETPNFFYIQISNFRKDLERPIDLIEEYSRFIGYKNFQEILPKKQLTYNQRKLNNYKFIRQFFINYGFNEVFTNSLISTNTKTNKFSLQLENPLNNETNTLRTSLFPKLFDVFDLNLKAGFNNCCFFEIGRVFKVSNNQIIEQDKISGIFQSRLSQNNKQNNANWFINKGFLELFLQNFGYENIEIKEIKNKTSYFHPTRSIQFKINDSTIGTFGEVTPTLDNFCNLKLPVYIFEFNLNYLKNWRRRKNIVPYTQYSKYPSIVRDLSFRLSKRENLSKLKTLLKNTSQDLKFINFFDIYFDPNFLEILNLGIRLEFQSETRTLTAQEIDQQMEQVILTLKRNFKIEI